MPVKIDPAITAELQEMDLVLWEAKHPKQPFFNEKTQKHSSREDKGWCVVSITGPGVDRECLAGGPTLREAVDGCLRTYFRDRVPGLRGAMMRLEHELFLTAIDMMSTRNLSGSDLDDDIPF